MRTVHLFALAGLALLAAAQGPTVKSHQVAGLTDEQREILSHMSIVYLPDGTGGTVKTIRVTGVNVQLVNGTGSTSTTNSVGNLIVGYNEPNRTFGSIRAGSHNIIVGAGNVWDAATHSGIATGDNHRLFGKYAVAIGGNRNDVSAFGVACGGTANRVAFATTVGGFCNNVSFGQAIGGSEVNVNVGTAIEGLSNEVNNGVAISGSFNQANGAIVIGGSSHRASGWYLLGPCKFRVGTERVSLPRVSRWAVNWNAHLA